MTLVLVAVITLTGSVVGPLLLSHLNNRQRRADKLEDWARQDAVAAQAQEAAALLLEQQRKTTVQTEEVARLAAENSATTQEQLDAIAAQGKIIHELVNQKLTTITEQALAAFRAVLELLEAGLARERSLGLSPSPASLKRVEDTKQSIGDLEKTLDQRAVNQASADAIEEE
jgi:hypothetical protein